MFFARLFVILAIIALTLLILYLFDREVQPRNSAPPSPPRPDPLPAPPSRPYVSKIDRLRQNLRTKTLHDEALIDRMIQNERERLPNANMEVWMEAAIARWEYDNR